MEKIIRVLLEFLLRKCVTNLSRNTFNSFSILILYIIFWIVYIITTYTSIEYFKI